MSGYTQTMERLIERLGRLPGIGARSAERIAFHLLDQPAEDVFLKLTGRKISEEVES